MMLANETLHMLSYLTTEIQSPFLKKEIVDRFAAMLNYHLVQMVGPKSTELKVKNPEKYHFSPKALLSSLIDVYLHMRPHAGFIEAIARDGRSYSKKWFDKATQVLVKWHIKSPVSCARRMTVISLHFDSRHFD